MVEEVSLRVGIDASPAKAGADSFKRSVTEIIRNAEKMGRTVGKSGDSFNKFKKVANDNSRALAGTAQSLRDVDTAVNRLSRSAGQVRSLSEAMRELSDSADSVRGRLNEAAASSNEIAGNFSGNLGKSASSLTSTLIDLGLAAR